MPDWSYHPLFKPLLSRLPGSLGREFIHKGMSTIARLPGGIPLIEFLGHMGPSEKLNKNLFGVKFKSPIGLSGKIDPLLSGINAFPHLGFGFIEIGPVTCEPNKPEEAVVYSKESDAFIFPGQLETIGVAETIKRLRLLGVDKPPIIIRLGELGPITEKIKGLGDVFVIGLNQVNTIDEFSSLSKKLDKKPILLSIKHSEAAKDFKKLKSFSELASGIMIDEDVIQANDRSMTPLKQTKEMLEAIEHLKTATKLPIIISGGIVEPADALALFSAGAELVLLSGGYVTSGPGLPKRINEALVDNTESDNDEVSGWIWYWLFGLSILLAGTMALIFSLTKVILFYDEAYLQMTRLELMTFNPNLFKFMSHDRMTLAGTMISGGFIYMQLAKHGVRYGIHWTRRAINIAAISGFTGIFLFLGYGYFDWLHALLWLVLLPFFILGYRKSKGAIQAPSSKNRTNHAYWIKGIYGQLAFVILGFSFVLGGIIISTIGASYVFVDTDLQYICMTPDQLNQLNEKLIPVIAHDRAGFGSALFSVGLLVLMLALWGFQEGAKWVWRTFLFGGIPAFFTGIFTHLYIGYIDFIHLLPAYFALALYSAGLWLTKDFFTSSSKASL